MATLIPVTPAALRRHLHYGDKGNDVKAAGRLVARALKANTFYKPVNAQNGVFGDGLLKDILRLQIAYQLPRTGTVDLATWQALDPQIHAYERFLLKLAPKPKPIPNGVKITAKARVLLAWGLRIYTQRRPAAITDAQWRSLGSDCSGSNLKCIADATGVPWNGYGYTGSMWTQGISVKRADVQVGDSIFYGRNGVTEHVAMVSNVAGRKAIGFGATPGRELDWFYRDDFMGFRRLA